MELPWEPSNLAPPMRAKCPDVRKKLLEVYYTFNVCRIVWRGNLLRPRPPPRRET